MSDRAWWRCASAMVVVSALVGSAPLVTGTARAINPPVVDPGAVPSDVTPRPEEPLQMRRGCAVTGVLPNSDLGAPSPSQVFMNLPELWRSAGKGAGVSVAVIDTGVSPSPRLDQLRGAGDYVVEGGDGLTDCDSHGTIVASIIAGSASEGDGFVGVAPDAEIISIRQSSGAYVPANPTQGDIDADRRAGTVSTLAKAVVVAANSGARVINMSVVACIPTLKPVDQTTLGAALRYAAIDKDVVLVAAAGNRTGADCNQNPDIDATAAADPTKYRNWNGVVTISTPAWFSDYVLSVTATDGTGQVAVEGEGQGAKEISLFGPWVGVGAPGVGVQGLNDRGELINATFNADKNVLQPMNGTSFSAAYVSGVAALIRAKYPNLTAHQVINRIKGTAHSPAAVVDNRLGYGTINPVAALNNDVVEGEQIPRERLSRPLHVAPPPPPPDKRPMIVALTGTGILLGGAVFTVGLARLIGRKGKTP
ncbi:type VII secretion-associated serine protease mycosin [Mycolicibacterium goodii]|nr:type VII secretion-associated serine protease mycosin [Mycolicibacterium goodii]